MRGKEWIRSYEYSRFTKNMKTKSILAVRAFIREVKRGKMSLTLQEVKEGRAISILIMSNSVLKY